MSPGFASAALAGFAVLALVHVGTHSMLLKASVGNDWTVGARDTSVRPGVFAGRAGRALRNFLETAPAFLALMLAVHVAQRNGALVVLGGWAYLAGRVVYLPAYLSGIRYLRTASWLVASIGLIIMLAGVFWP
ncbi:MAG: MAPEG family protein [Rhodobacteraceae bacterium]|nr:MAPEG family protein [Paracoccaceae bacterium]